MFVLLNTATEVTLRETRRAELSLNIRDERRDERDERA